MAVLADAPAVGPRLVDEVEYEPYGRARRTAQGDFNHSGSISPQDNFDFLNAYFAAAPAGDENDDGSVSVQDIFDFQSEYFGADTTPSDRISGWSVFGIIDNPYGYCGYYADHETAAAKVLGPGGGALYSVRFRVYDPIAGRWLTRDPAGFVDGMNLYEYCGGGAVGWWDPLGLFGCDGPDDGYNPIDHPEDIARRGQKTGLKDTWTPEERERNRRIAERQDQMARDIAIALGKATVHTVTNAAMLFTGPAAAALLAAIDAYVMSDGDLVAAGESGAIVLAIAGVLHIAPSALSKMAGSEIAEGFGKVVADAESQIGRKLTAEEIELLAKEGSLPEAAGKSAANGARKHYLHRPYIRKSVREEVERRAHKVDGRFVDPNTQQPIDGKPHLGHKRGYEYWRMRDEAEKEGLTQAEFNERMNNPDLYQLEDPHENMSHRHERPK